MSTIAALVLGATSWFPMGFAMGCGMGFVMGCDMPRGPLCRKVPKGHVKGTFRHLHYPDSLSIYSSFVVVHGSLVMTQRSTPRLRKSDVGVLSRVHDRDLEIASVVAELTVVTTSQLARLYFGAPQVARRRLTELVEMGVLERFKPVRFHRPKSGAVAQIRQPVGTSPWHYVLGELGARLIGALRGEVITWRPEAAFKLARSQRLGHYVAVAEFYTALRLGQMSKP